MAFVRPRPMSYRPLSSCRLLLTAALAATGAASASAQTLDTGVNVGISSAWLMRGISLTQGGTTPVFVGADAYSTSGWSVGGLVAHLQTGDGKQTNALNARTGYEYTFDGRWTLLAQLRHLSYPESDVLRAWCYNEVGASLADTDRWVLSWSAETRRGPGCNQHFGPIIVSRSIELNGRYPLDGGFHLGAGMGRRMYGGGLGYLYGQAGGGWAGWGGVKLLLDHVWVSPEARDIYGDIARNRWVLTGLYSF
jgi:hypothetical protein